jgi:hypothetical protein
MKRKLFSLAILVMALAVAFIGCSTDSDDDDDEQETFTNVAESYPINGAHALSPSGLSIASVLKSNTTGIVKVTLDGEVGTTFQYASTGSSPAKPSNDWIALWADPTDGTTSFNPEEAVYGTFSFKPFSSLPQDASALSIAVKQTNDALRYYRGATTGDAFVANEPLEQPTMTNTGSIYIPSSGTATRWRVWGDGVITSTETYEVLLWSGVPANQRIITLEIQSVDGTTYTTLDTIVIDYSNVSFEE